LQTATYKGHAVELSFRCYQGRGDVELSIDGVGSRAADTYDGLAYALITGSTAFFGYVAQGAVQQSSFVFGPDIDCSDHPEMAGCSVPPGGNGG
jgi:hypothetical protein